MAHARQFWESGSDVEPSPPDEPMDAESSAEAELGPSPTDEFIALMVNLVISREVSAKVFCTAMFWASKAGIPAAAKYGYKPDAPSGHYNRHLRTVLGCYSKENYAKLYHLLVPSTSTEGLGRDAHSLAALPPHEVVAEDAVADRAMLAELDSIVRARALPPRYFDSRVVRDSPAGSPPAIPLALFVDGVPYSHVDSVVGFWVINQVSGKRFLVAAFRKKLACQPRPHELLELEPPMPRARAVPANEARRGTLSRPRGVARRHSERSDGPTCGGDLRQGRLERIRHDDGLPQLE